ncbi:SulP family inorganic anion transporter [Saccharopolyspora sp. NFXS83]|uniref:SulP family inorganic anion transporter n=1 Tax=Saccharopolyspora sp. NFXS83 TaxID=2993560 RepID=UPI00224A96CB|nr:SulP family inorganic anion transporter [Saccharopolyspora sp. NFXS83]MCX2732736.1 SulP family inorganic anion transporter [Saccharopolyspora sp. NFXS83]
MSSAETVAAPGIPARLRRAWWSNPRADLLSGLVVALALIPEALSFSVIAGVDPKVGLYASFSIAIIISLAGGRPAMISAATGAMALVMVPLVREHGVEYMLAATVLAGVFQVVLGLLGVHRLMRFVPRTVMLGFVNALAILLFTAQLPHLTGVGLPVYGLVALGLAIIYLLPKVTRAVPSPLVAIVVITAISVGLGFTVPTVGDQGELPDALPVLGIPAVPLTTGTLLIVAPFALTLALVGLLESLLTARLLDDITDTRSNKATEVRGQGIANVITGLLGGMAGCAMIGQSMINVKSGGRTRLSTLAAGVFLFVLVMSLGEVVALIPMAALVAVMVFVSISTFDWGSVSPKRLRGAPRAETAVMVVTVAVVVATGNLALGVLCGVLLSAVFFAHRVAHHVEVSSVLDPDGGTRIHRVTGQLFFASTNDFVHAFDDSADVDAVVLDLSGARIWDSSAVTALDAVVARFAARGVAVEITGLDEHSARLHARLSEAEPAPAGAG